MNHPKISVLMPIYKTAPYLKEAVDSILSQTYVDFELIALNDCSPDNAEEILDGYDDERIVRYRGSENVGLANILNIGIGMSRGEYIARMDSDDVSLPNRFEVQMKYFESHPDTDLVSCGVQQFGTTSRTICFDDDSLDDVKFRSLFYTPILHASSIWKKKSFTDKGLHFNQNMVPAEDYDLWNRALANGLHLHNIPDVLYFYRMFDGQATSNLERVSKAVERVKTHYFRTLFHEESDSFIDSLVRLEPDSISDPFAMKRTLKWLETVNYKYRYFDQNLLRGLVKKKCSSHFYAYGVRNGFKLCLVPHMKIKHTAKLIKNEVFGHHTCL